MAYCRICKTKIGAVFWTLISCQKSYVTCATTDKLKRVYIELFLKYVAHGMAYLDSSTCVLKMIWISISIWEDQIKQDSKRLLYLQIEDKFHLLDIR